MELSYEQEGQANEISSGPSPKLETVSSTQAGGSTSLAGNNAGESGVLSGAEGAVLPSAGANEVQAKGAVQKANGSGAGNTGEIFTPNFKFKVKDKELEFDDFIKPIVKDKQLEAKIREMYEKAHGLDEVKTARESFRTQVEEWKGKYTQVEDSLKTLGGLVNKGDFRTFFQALNIPKEKIIQYAIEELKYNELPPEQRAAIEQQRAKEQEFLQTQTQNQQLQTQMAQLVQQQAAFQLDQALAAPDVGTVAASYDARVGTPGAFRQEVIRRGQYYEAVHKVSPPAHQLVGEIIALIGAQGGTQAQGTPGQVVQTQQQQQQKPGIQTFSGGSKSPARKVPSSVDDLRKLRQQITT